MSNEERKSTKKQGSWADLLNDLGIDSKAPESETQSPAEPLQEQPEPQNGFHSELAPPAPVFEPEQPKSEQSDPLITWDTAPKKEWNLSEIFDQVVPPPASQAKELERFPKIDLFGPTPNKSGHTENIFFKHETKETETPAPARPAVDQRPRAGSNDPWSKIASQLGVLSSDPEEAPAEERKAVSKGDTEEDRGSRKHSPRNRNRRHDSESKVPDPPPRDREERKQDSPAKTATSEKRDDRSSRENQAGAGGRRGSRGFASGIIPDNEPFFAIDTASLDSGYEPESVTAEESLKTREGDPGSEESSEKHSRRRRRRSKKERPIYPTTESTDEYALEIRIPETDNLDLEFVEEAPTETPALKPSRSNSRGRGVRTGTFSPEETVYEDEVEEIPAPRETRERSTRRRPKPELNEEEPDPADMEEIRQHVHKSIPTWGDAVATVVEGNMIRHAAKKHNRPKRR